MRVFDIGVRVAESARSFIRVVLNASTDLHCSLSKSWIMLTCISKRPTLYRASPQMSTLCKELC